MIRPLLIVLLALPLMACNSPFSSTQTNQQVGSIALGVGIYRLEKHYDVNCSLYNILEEGEYCVSKYKPSGREEVHCFKTLGGVDCYTEKDPYMLAGRSLPAAPRSLADPRMPMDPGPNRLNKVIERLENLIPDETLAANTAAPVNPSAIPLVGRPVNPDAAPIAPAVPAAAAKD